MGPTLIGGIVGAAVGVALHLLIETATPIEAPWFAIVIGVLTGLGVRQANKSLEGKVSYARGAISAAIALTAIVIGPQVIARVASQRTPHATVTVPKGDAATAPPAEGEKAASAEGGGTDAKSPAAEGGRGEMGSELFVGHRPRDLDVWQFMFMAVGTLVAYQFARGNGKPAASASSVEPVAMDPSN